MPGSTTLSKTKKILKNQGLFHLIIRTIGYVYRIVLRPLLPKIGYPKTGLILEKKSGKKRGTRKPLDRFLPEYFHYSSDAEPYYFSETPPIDSELGLQLAHRALTQKSDHVVVIGGGRGLSSTVAAKQVGADGKVTIYDARARSKTMDDNLSINQVRDRCELHQAIIISESNVKGKILEGLDDESDIPIVNPADLPNCDVLEFDCTGSELDIIRNLTQRPRILIIEVEAYMYNSLYDGQEHPRDLLKEVSDLGYYIIQQTDHVGQTLTRDDLLNHIDTIYERGENGINATLETGVHSPIIYAIREDFAWEIELDT